jgi:hypothetical protein
MDASLIRAVPELGPRGFEQVKKALVGAPAALQIDVRNARKIAARVDALSASTGEVVNARLEIAPGSLKVFLGFHPRSTGIEWDGLGFGFRLRDALGVLVAEREWPLPGQVFLRSSAAQEYYKSAMVKGLTIDAKYSIEVWSVNAGEEFGTTTSFSVPRPPQPFPSWTWGPGWTAPTAYPQDGNDYAWNESALSWEPAP